MGDKTSGLPAILEPHSRLLGLVVPSGALVFTVYTMYEMTKARCVFLMFMKSRNRMGGCLLVDLWVAYLRLWVGASNHRTGFRPHTPWHTSPGWIGLISGVSVLLEQIAFGEVVFMGHVIFPRFTCTYF